MAEDLTVDDVVAFTGGRLADDDETARLLEAGLDLVRKRCGWHVSPVLDNAVFTIDGCGGHELMLRTRKIVKVESVVNDGVTLNVATDVVIPSEYPWKLVRKSGLWSTQYGGVVATVDHGYTAAEAASWRQAVLAVVDRLAQFGQTGRADTDLVRKQVGPVTYQWIDPTAAGEALLSVDHILSGFDLKWMFL